MTKPIAPVLNAEQIRDIVGVALEANDDYEPTTEEANIARFGFDAGYAAASGQGVPLRIDGPDGDGLYWLRMSHDGKQAAFVLPEVPPHSIMGEVLAGIAAAPPATPDKVSGEPTDLWRAEEALRKIGDVTDDYWNESNARYNAALDASPPAPAVERYRHYKGGEYELIRTALREADGHTMCVYRPVGTDVWWVRPIGEFEMKFAKIAPAAGSPAAGAQDQTRGGVESRHANYGLEASFPAPVSGVRERASAPNAHSGNKGTRQESAALVAERSSLDITATAGVAPGPLGPIPPTPDDGRSDAEVRRWQDVASVVEVRAIRAESRLALAVGLLRRLGDSTNYNNAHSDARAFLADFDRAKTGSGT